MPFLSILTILISAILFVSIVIVLAKEQNHKYIWVEYLLVGASILGVCIYGYGFYCAKDNIVLAIIKSLLATLNMFLGKNEFNEIKEAPLMKNQIAICVFWAVHIVALFVTANAILTTIGAKALRQVKRALVWNKKEVVVIYGTQDNCISLAKELKKEKAKRSIIFVDDKIGDDVRKSIEGNECVALVKGKEKLIRGRFINVDLVKVFCLKEEEDLNIQFAKDFLKDRASYKNRIKETALTLLADMTTVDGAEFQKNAENEIDGFDTVYVVDTPYLVSKTLVDNYQPCETLSFDENYCADHDFHVVIVGFGKIGQAVLKKIYMNGHFLGNRFKASIFDPCYDQRKGFFTEMNPSMDNSDYPGSVIQGFSIDAGQSEFFNYFDSNDVDQVCICINDEYKSSVISNEIMAYLKKKKHKYRVFDCMCDYVTAHIFDEASGDHINKKNDVYVKKMLDISEADRIAMEINHSYLSDEDKKKQTKEDAWALLPYFSRMSSRSCADFIPVYSYITKQNDKKGRAYNTEALAKLEHLRFCSFHFASGYKTMDHQEFNKRAMEYKEDHKKIGKKFHRNEAAYTHACLITWDDLKTLAEKQSEVLVSEGESPVDYQKSTTEAVKNLMPWIEKYGTDGVNMA